MMWGASEPGPPTLNSGALSYGLLFEGASSPNQRQVLSRLINSSDLAFLRCLLP